MHNHNNMSKQFVSKDDSQQNLTAKILIYIPRVTNKKASEIYSQIIIPSLEWSLLYQLDRGVQFLSVLSLAFIIVPFNKKNISVDTLMSPSFKNVKYFKMICIPRFFISFVL